MASILIRWGYRVVILGVFGVVLGLPGFGLAWGSSTSGFLPRLDSDQRLKSHVPLSVEIPGPHFHSVILPPNPSDPQIYVVSQGSQSSVDLYTGQKHYYKFYTVSKVDVGSSKVVSVLVIDGGDEIEIVGLDHKGELLFIAREESHEPPYDRYVLYKANFDTSQERRIAELTTLSENLPRSGPYAVFFDTIVEPNGTRFWCLGGYRDKVNGGNDIFHFVQFNAATGQMLKEKRLDQQEYFYKMWFSQAGKLSGLSTRSLPVKGRALSFHEINEYEGTYTTKIKNIELSSDGVHIHHDALADRLYVVQKSKSTLVDRRGIQPAGPFNPGWTNYHLDVLDASTGDRIKRHPLFYNYHGQVLWVPDGKPYEAILLPDEEWKYVGYDTVKGWYALVEITQSDLEEKRVELRYFNPAGLEQQMMVKRHKAILDTWSKDLLAR